MNKKCQFFLFILCRLLYNAILFVFFGTNGRVIWCLSAIYHKLKGVDSEIASDESLTLSATCSNPSIKTIYCIYFM